MSNPTRVLSLGAGVNSTALLILAKTGKVEFDEVCFADTGCEKPETYQYINTVIYPLCQELNKPLIIVKSKFGNLYDYAYHYKMIPSRLFRWCTDKFKIRPLNEHYRNKEVTWLVGIDAGEKHRAKNFDSREYPLIEMDLNRKDCIKIIKSAGYPIPVKSGCYICPFKRRSEWVELLKKYPDLYSKTELLEKNNNHYPTLKFLPITLEEFRVDKEAQRSLCDTMPGLEQCVVCHT